MTPPKVRQKVSARTKNLSQVFWILPSCPVPTQDTLPLWIFKRLATDDTRKLQNRLNKMSRTLLKASRGFLFSLLFSRQHLESTQNILFNTKASYSDISLKAWVFLNKKLLLPLYNLFSYFCFILLDTFSAIGAVAYFLFSKSKTATFLSVNINIIAFLQMESKLSGINRCPSPQNFMSLATATYHRNSNKEMLQLFFPPHYYSSVEQQACLQMSVMH